MRVIFMGTSELSVTVLEALVKAGYEIVQVYTRADKPAGRGRKQTPPPVREAAERVGLPVYQPVSIKSPDEIEKLRELRPDIVVIAAYGRLIPKDMLDIPPLKFINIHPSLLPKYRGPAPINGPILAGDDVTGVSIFELEETMDTGPLLAQTTVPISPEDTAETLSQRLAEVGASLLLEVLPRWARGEITPQPQDHEKATYTHIIKKEEGRLEWSRPAVELWRQVRGFLPWPGAFTTWKGQNLKVLEAEVVPSPLEGEPGRTLLMHDPRESGRMLPAVLTGEGVLVLRKLQLEGRRPLEGHVFLLGERDFAGSQLG